MKKDIHPKYFPKAHVKCACGNTFAVGSTREKLEVDICSKCHPFYTGTQQLIDTRGRVERFKTRAAKAVPVRRTKKEKKEKKTTTKKSSKLTTKN